VSRRVYTPRARPNRGANIRLGICNIEEHHDQPLGRYLLRRFVGPDTFEANGDLALGAVVPTAQRGMDGCGAIAGRIVWYKSFTESARLNVWGRGGKDEYVVPEPPTPPVPPGPLSMRFTAVSPNLATPGDQVYVSGENVENIFNVMFHPTVTVDGFGKRHVVIDGIEYIEL